MLPVIAGAMLLVFTAAATYYLKSYRPTRVPVVEQARTPHDVRAKFRAAARLRLRTHEQRRTGRNQIELQVSHQEAPDRPAGVVASATPITTPPPAPFAPTRPLVQPVLAHHAHGAPRPGSYFRAVEVTCPESLTSDVRGPWAAPIVDGDGRITMPDNGMDVALTWRHAEDGPPR